MGNERTANENCSFYVLYVGSIEILKSMRGFDFDQKTALSRECITKVAESGHRIASRKRKVDKFIKDSIGNKSDLNYAGSNVCFIIKPSGFSVTKIDTNEVLFTHLVPMISFASCGDDFAPDFVSYIANNEINRRCYVFECCRGTAKLVLTAIQQSWDAFKLRLQISEPPNPKESRSNSEPSCPAINRTVIAAASALSPGVATSLSPTTSFKWPFANSPVSPTVSPKSQAQIVPTQNFAFYNADSPTIAQKPNEYENDNETTFDFVLKPVIVANVEILQNEPWFYGRLTRERSESLIQTNGQFLVRQSDKDPNVLVLTGMHNGIHQHLSLVDMEGNVRTKDRRFDNVCHLIQHHRENKIPIAWFEHWVVLSHPVNR